MMKAIVLLGLALAVSACAPLTVNRDEAGGRDPADGGSLPERNGDPAPGPSAVLLEQSRSQRAAGEYAGAAALLERAVRIEPGNPQLWLELARVHFAAGDLRQAQAHAHKALSLAGPDRGVSKAAGDLLDDIAGR